MIEGREKAVVDTQPLAPRVVKGTAREERGWQERQRLAKGAEGYKGWALLGVGNIISSMV